jgi:arabinogalactan endo-1,4-beta-galactosidase
MVKANPFPAAHVRDNDRRIKIMIHASNGGDNALYRKLFDPLVKAGIDFDVIGLSFPIGTARLPTSSPTWPTLRPDTGSS